MFKQSTECNSKRFVSTTARAVTLRWELQIELDISPGHSILTPGKPALALTFISTYLAGYLGTSFEVKVTTRPG